MIGGSTRTDGQELYIFVTSARPDPYVNVLAHVLRTRPISSVHYISIREHGYSAEQVNDRLISITAGIHAYLHSLRDRLAADDKPAAAVYEKCLDKLDSISTSNEVIPWVELDEKLKIFSTTGSSIFDVTSLKKNLLVDVVSLLLSRGCIRVYNFELLKSPNYDESDLIHALDESEFTYRSLGDSRHVEIARKRMLANFLTLRQLSFVTAGVALSVLVIQAFFGSTWLQTFVTVLGTATSIAGFLFFIIRNAK
ncbi:hypothetical protein GCM10009555_020460 [Acrocarpospora macrocephala]|uniref:Uncharacterized protein n=1 Tax=Acrocarpospora macrocephala TaxID=150177 RepID=A0A5M3WG94_9ACTN|nr:hypothetical protein [Acrocarpospora macrocephala]GES07954.1 hypothetical protein Amac_015490 [Acrocarpospora macrocephala]